MRILPGAYNPKLPTLMIDLKTGHQKVINATVWPENKIFIEVEDGGQKIYFNLAGTCISGKRILVNFSETY